MSGVRDRLQQLIQDLEEEDQPATSAGEGRYSKAHLNVAEGEVSSVSLGLSDLTRTENSEDDPTPGTTAQQQQQSRRHSSSSSANGLRRHVAELEAKVLELLLDKKAAEARHARETAARDAELTRLQDYIDQDLSELQQRQSQVEATAPNVRQQLQEAHSALHSNLVVSAETYAQLKKIPPGRLQLADAVRIAVHEALQELSADNERLSLSASAARETAARQADELSRLQRDNARMSSALAATQAEAERLSGQLQDTIVAAEVGCAKVLLYDELSTKAEKLEAEVSRLSGIDASADRLRAQLAAADAALSDRDATLQLLTADKAYLSKEVQVAESRVSELTARLATAEDKVTALKGERSRLYQQMAAAADASRNPDESRWERELTRLQQAAAADLQRIRQEATEAAEREARLLRDLRDAALDEASRTKSELRQMREAHEDLLLASRDAASRADVLNSQLMGELKLKGFELSRLQALSEERASAIEKLQLQLDLANEKVAVLTAELSHLEQEGRQGLQQLQQQLAEAKTKLREYAADDGHIERAITTAAAAGDAAVSSLEQHLASLLPSAQPTAAGSDPNSTLSRAMQRRVHHNIQLAARCAHLEAQKQALEAEQAQLSTKLDKAQAAVEKLHQQLSLVGQPHSFLIKQLAAAEATAAATQAELTAAKEALSAREAQSSGVAAERAALRRDLEKLLRERGTLESLRQVVASAMKSQQGQTTGGAGGNVVANEPPAADVLQPDQRSPGQQLYHQHQPQLQRQQR